MKLTDWVARFKERFDNRQNTIYIIADAAQKVSAELSEVGIYVSIIPASDDFFDPIWKVSLANGSNMDVTYTDCMHAALQAGASRPFKEDDFISAWKGILMQAIV